MHLTDANTHGPFSWFFPIYILLSTKYLFFGLSDLTNSAPTDIFSWAGFIGILFIRFGLNLVCALEISLRMKIFRDFSHFCFFFLDKIFVFRAPRLRQITDLLTLSVRHDFLMLYPFDFDTIWDVPYASTFYMFFFISIFFLKKILVFRI